LTDDYSRTLTGSPCWKSNQPASVATWPREVAKTSFRTKEVRSQYLKRQRVVVTTKREQEVRRLPIICCGCRYRLITGRAACCLCQLFYFASDGAKYCDERVCIPVCLSVCTSICPLLYLKNGIQTSRNFLYMLPVTITRSSSDDHAICHVLPVLWMTSCLHIIAQAKATPIGCILEVTHQAAAPGQERSLMSTIALSIKSHFNTTVQFSRSCVFALLTSIFPPVSEL